jgi:hypothetical protein
MMLKGDGLGHHGVLEAMAAWLLRQQPIMDVRQHMPQHDPNASSCDLRISQAHLGRTEKPLPR